MVKVLISAPYMQPIVERFRPFFESNGIEIVVPVVNERLEEDELLELFRTSEPSIHGTICGDDRYTARVLHAASPTLKVISKWGTGIDSIDQTTCAELGIAVCNTPNAFSEPVADTVLGYVLCFARQLTTMTDSMQNGEWEKIPGRALRECTLGVIGVGNVGTAVIRRAVAFGMTVLGNDIREIDSEFVAAMNLQMVSKQELFEKADFVSLNCDYNTTSHHVINDDTLALMKPSSALINTARGPLVEEAALIRALEAKCIAGAGLDVFEHEPLPVDSPLRKMPNVMMGPHNSNSSPQAWEHVHINTINNLIQVLQKAFPENEFHLAASGEGVSSSSCPGQQQQQQQVPKQVNSNNKRVVLITGAAGGIGSATAHVFFNEGWHVVGVDRRQMATTPWIHQFIQADISDVHAAENIMDEIKATTGCLHALVNNAAMQLCKSILDTNVQEWDSIMESNVRQIFLTCKASFPLLRETKGSIINISSVHALGTSRDIAAYATSKGAILAMSRAMALDFGPYEIRVNAVLPGAVDTTMLRSGLGRGHVTASDSVEDKVRALGKKHVMGRVGDPHEIGQAILFLADGTRSSFITGQSLVVDGGAMARLSTE